MPATVRKRRANACYGIVAHIKNFKPTKYHLIFESSDERWAMNNEHCTNESTKIRWNVQHSTLNIKIIKLLLIITIIIIQNSKLKTLWRLTFSASMFYCVISFNLYMLRFVHSFIMRKMTDKYYSRIITTLCRLGFVWSVFCVGPDLRKSGESGHNYDT